MILNKIPWQITAQQGVQPMYGILRHSEHFPSVGFFMLPGLILTRPSQLRQTV